MNYMTVHRYAGRVSGVLDARLKKFLQYLTIPISAFFMFATPDAQAVQTYNPVFTNIAIPANYTEMLIPAYQGRIQPTGAYYARYPSASHNMQFMAFRNPSTNQIFYVQTQDPDGQVIDWNIGGSGTYTLRLTIQSLSSTFPSNFYITDSTMTAASETEFYRKVAHKYKSWAINQKWAKRKASKFDTMVTAAVVPNLQTATMTGKVAPFIGNWSGENTVCWVTFWRQWWQLGLDGGIPDYRMRNEPQSATSVSWMSANNCSPFPYTNALLWDSLNVNTPGVGTVPTYGDGGKLINNTESAAYNEIVANNPSAQYTQDVEKIMIKDKFGNIESLAPKRPHMKYACQATSTWQTTFQNAAESIANNGWKGIYYDMAAFTAPKLCYRNDHGHDIADPLAWQNGIRQILTTLHTNNITKDLMVVTEGNAEIYMDLVDAFLSYGETEFDDDNGSIKQVPLFKEVYGDIARFIGWQLFPVADPQKKLADLTASIMTSHVKKAANFGSMFYGAPYFFGWEGSYEIQDTLLGNANYANLFDLINNPQYKKVVERGGGAINWVKSGVGSAPAAVNAVDGETGAAAVSFGMPNRDSGESYQLPINESNLFQLSWDMKMKGNYYVSLTLTGSDGNTYYMLYDQNARNFRSTVTNYLKIGLGADTTAAGGGQWRTIRRDLAADFQDALPNPKPTLTKVNSMRVYGTGLVDNITFSNSPTVYENGSGVGNWTAVGSGLTKAAIYDTETLSDVVQFSGMTGRDNNQYYVRTINDNQRYDVSWDLKTAQSYYVLITVSADDGSWWNLLYDQNARDFRDTVGGTVKFGLGADTADGKWRTFRRNLADDLFEGTGKNIYQVIEMRVYAAGSLDNVLFWGNGIRTSGR